jgi:hypothetical protein
MTLYCCSVPENESLLAQFESGRATIPRVEGASLSWHVYCDRFALDKGTFFSPHARNHSFNDVLFQNHYESNAARKHEYNSITNNAI